MYKKTLVVGASLKPNRYSNIAIKRLRENNVETVAFGLKEGTVEDVPIDTKLMPHANVHTVTLYLNPQRQKPYYDYIIGLKPKRIIFNPGTENIEFQNILKQEGIAFEEACTLVLLSINKY